MANWELSSQDVYGAVMLVNFAAMAYRGYVHRRLSAPAAGLGGAAPSLLELPPGVPRTPDQSPLTVDPRRPSIHRTPSRPCPSAPADRILATARVTWPALWRLHPGQRPLLRLAPPQRPPGWACLAVPVTLFCWVPPALFAGTRDALCTGHLWCSRRLGYRRAWGASVSSAQERIVIAVLVPVVTAILGALEGQLGRQ
jgi:hypothetical protein